MILDEEVWEFVPAECMDRLEAVGSSIVPGTRGKGSKSSRERLAIFESGERGVIYSDPRLRLAMIICPDELLPSAEGVSAVPVVEVIWQKCRAMKGD